MERVKIIAELLAPFTRGEAVERIELSYGSAPAYSEVIDSIEEKMPGFRKILLDGRSIRPGISVLKDGINVNGDNFQERKIERSCSLVFCIAVSGG